MVTSSKMARIKFKIPAAWAYMVILYVKFDSIADFFLCSETCPHAQLQTRRKSLKMIQINFKMAAT